MIEEEELVPVRSTEELLIDAANYILFLEREYRKQMRKIQKLEAEAAAVLADYPL